MPLEGIKICLDPGHGGEDADDRPTDLGIGPIYYESNANWDAVLQLEQLLLDLGADVKITKTTNDPDDPDRDPSLADRVQVANAFGSDYFHSYHTNGFTDPQTNYSLVLYAGPEDGLADFTESIDMADIMSQELFKVARTTTTFARADIPFTGFMNGLGVLNNLNMPSTLSEVSFHTNLDEGRRLMNTKYLRATAWAIAKSFLKYYDKDLSETGELGGIVSDLDGIPLNNIEIIVNEGSSEEKIYSGDLFLNGFYFFDSLAIGEHEVLISKFGYESQRQTVEIETGKYTELDASLNTIGGAPSSPKLNSILSFGNEGGLKAEWTQNPEVSLLGYRLYYATDDDLQNWVLAADETSLDADVTSISLNAYSDYLVEPSSDVYHFRLSAIAESGAESGSSDVYSRSNGSAEESILVVDGFDRFSGSFNEEVHSFASDYLIALRNSNTASVSTISNEGLVAKPSLLDSFEMLIWFLGDESTADESLDESEQVLLRTYLQNGGKLILTGSEIAWDLDNKGSSSDRDFYRQYLKARYDGDGSSNFTPAEGIGGTLFEDIIYSFGIVYPEDFPDELLPEGGAEALLEYNSPGGIAGVGFKGMFPDGQESGGLVNFGFALETAERADLESLLRQSLTYLELGEIISSLKEEISLGSELFDLKLTPNPSFGNTKLLISNTRDLSLRGSMLSIFDGQGRSILSKRIIENMSVTSITLPAASWSAGLYHINLRQNNNSANIIYTKIK